MKQLVDMQDKEDWEELVRYSTNGVEWLDALDCVQWSADVLAQLRFLPQDNHLEKTV